MKTCNVGLLGAVVLTAIQAAVTSFAAEPDKPLSAEESEFFESKIRPALIENCYKCHSAESDKIKGGLALDSKIATLKGGSSGPAIEPGNAEKSLFIKAIRYLDPNLQMPPKEKLSDAVIADFEAWVKMGAPDPRTGKQGGILKSEADRAKAKAHWSFQPVKKPEVPQTKLNLKKWVQNPVDSFILAKLEEKRMIPSFPADKVTLIRRAYFDLVGFPPSQADVEAFVSDDSPEAFTKVVDGLLDSPHYGERWGRYWLDLARYSDTRGGNNNNMGPNRFIYSFTYRDYVVDAFNRDKPYDQFLVEQIAADQVAGDDKKALAAMGFFTLGRQGANMQDTIDDRIDTLTRSTLALSVYCARCHDHKFDPIPTADYYSLYGVFASSIEPAEKPLLEAPADTPEYREFVARQAAYEEELDNFRIRTLNGYLTKARTNLFGYLLAAHDLSVSDEKMDRAESEKFARDRKLEVFMVQRWSSYIKKAAGRKNDPIFAPWAAYNDLSDKEFAAKGRELAAEYKGEAGKKLNPLVARAFSTPASSFNVVIDRYVKLFADAERQWQSTVILHEKKKASAKEEEAAPKGLADPAQEELRKVLYGNDSPLKLSYDQLAGLNNNRIRNQEGPYLDKLVNLQVSHPGSPKRAMALMDQKTPKNATILIKGSPNNRGAEVPRQFLEILSGPDRRPFSKGSGRLELAKAIASKDNPLTARVFVNRVWYQHFGGAIVRTISDFGMRAQDPSHPELLDWLASYFMENNWSIKKLHRLIMLSNTYQQSSDDVPQFSAIDPNNLLFHRMNRRRLDFEAFRDNLLTISGKMDLTMGGQSVSLTQEPFSYRRTMYGFIDRRNLATIFRTFDFANPEATVGERFNSTVPQQALFMMNSPFVADLARGLVQRTDFKNEVDDVRRIEAIYQAAFQRQPDPIEVKLASRFLESASGIKSDAREPIWKYGYGDYDEKYKAVKRFYPLPHFTGKAWQGGPLLPDSRYGMLSLDGKGGHPGNIKQLAVIRRFTAPKDATLTIEASLAHTSKEGDGVQAFIVSSRGGELGRWTVHSKKVDTNIPKVEMKRGDTIDFIVTCNANPRSDQFTWSPTVRIAGPAPVKPVGAAMAKPMGGGDMIPGDEAREWKAGAEFEMGARASRQKPLETWERFCQVLLLSNELMFVD